MNRKELYRLLEAELSRPATGDDNALAAALRRFIAAAAGKKTSAVLADSFRQIARRRGRQSAYNIIKRLEVSFALRKPTLAIYDHTLHLIGGAQKYGCTMAHALQDDFDVTLLVNKPVRHLDLQNWYGLDLSRCRISTIALPFYEAQNKEHLDPAAITSRRMPNPFQRISLASGDYDFFVNNSMVEMVFPLADPSLFICHFPERRPSSYFYVDRYRHIVFNSLYTAGWIRKKWNLRPGIHLYPPVDMGGVVDISAKENIILSAARFDPGGNKQQLRMVQLFKELSWRQPQVMGGWKLVLAGGSPVENPYLEEVRQAIAASGPDHVELQVNIPAPELKSLYRQSSIFWHLCGLDRDEPELVEHFGMTTAEAMQNGCVPVVFAGGGMVEIVENNISGLLFSSKSQLARQTLKLIGDPGLLQKMAEHARQRGRVFGHDVFSARVKAIFSTLLDEYRISG